MIFKKLLLVVAIAVGLISCGGGGANDPIPAARQAQMATQLSDSQTTVLQLYLAFYGAAPSNPNYTFFLAAIEASNPQGLAAALGNAFAARTDVALASTVLTNLGITPATVNSAAYEALSTALPQVFSVYPGQRSIVVLNLVKILATLEGNPAYAGAAQTGAD